MDYIERKTLKKKRSLALKAEKLQQFRLFVGGMNWTDLKGQNYTKILALRRRQLLKILETFGKVFAYQFHWKRGYIHVNFVDSESAEKALSTLEVFENRKKICSKLRKKVKWNPAGSLPPNFYIRYARCDSASTIERELCASE